MAHPPAVKAEALAMLILGDRVTYVAKVTGVPKQTVSRWKPEADAFLRDLIRSSPELQAVGAAIREVLTGLGSGHISTQRATFCNGWRGNDGLQ